MRGLARDISLAVGTAAAMGFTYGAHGPVLPLISSEFHLADVQAGLISTALFLSAALTMLALGGSLDRYEPRTLVAIGVALALAGNVASALAPSYEWLLAAKVTGGIAAAIGFLAGVRYVTARYGDSRSHFGQGLYGAGYPLGSAIGLWVMPSLALAWGWRGAFAATSVVIALVLLAWLAATAVPPTRRPGTIADAMRCRNCWGTAAQHAAGFGLVFAAATWITTFLLREFSLPLGASGILGSILLFVTVLARPAGGSLVAREHLRTLTVMRLAQLLILAGAALLAWPDRSLAVALVGTGAMGVGAGLPYASVFNTAAASLPARPAAAQSLTALGGFGGTLVGAPAMGYAIDTWGFSVAWLILGLISVFALVVTLVMRGEEDLAGAGA
ncbi:MAG: MFS transporter [Chloroflexota bacterium]|nr:MFS transporter [Chloroflexota bacterium]